MIINGFGGGVTDTLGLTILQPNTVLYNNGTLASGLTLGPSVKKITETVNLPDSSTWGANSIQSAARGVVALFAQPIYLVPLRGKTISATVANRGGSTNPWYGMSLCIAPYISPTQWSATTGMTTGNDSLSPQPVLGASASFCPTAAPWTTTLSVTITVSMVYGYICLGSGYGYTVSYYNNIRISA